MKNLLVALISATMLVPAFAQVPMNEQRARMQAIMQQAMQRSAMAPAPSAQMPAVTEATEAELEARIAGIPRGGEFYAIESRKDGFVVNGVPYIDPEGRIARYAVDPATGDAAYFAEITAGMGKLKWVHLSAPDAPVEFAAASKTPAGWSVSTASGKKINGDLLIVIPTGVLIGRPSAAFRYDPGKGIKNVAIPGGYMLAPLQRGAVGSTDTVLLEKEAADTPDNPILGIGKTLGRIVGAKSEDYALYNLGTKQIIPLNVDAGGKNTHSYSQCRRKNAMVNVCDQMTTFESIYDPQGNRNMGHYYWRIHWLKTRAGSYAIVQENGLKEINLIDLATGNRVTAVERMLGISSFSSELTREGNLRISAKLGFEDRVIDAAEALFQQLAVTKADPTSNPNEAASQAGQEAK